MNPGLEKAWQAALNVAYAEWQKPENQNWNFEEMVLNCDSQLMREVVLLGKMNQQIENGGFCQWVDNGYCTPKLLETIVTALDRTETGKQIVALIAKFAEYIEEDGWDWDEEYQESMGSNIADRCDDVFCKLQDQWHTELGLLWDGKLEQLGVAA